MDDAGATDEEKKVFILQQYQKFEWYVYWFLGELVFKDHLNCLDDHKDFVLNDIMKPKFISVIEYLTHVNYMCEIIPYLQAPSDEGETAARRADYAALQSDIDVKALHRAQYNGLPKVFQNETEDQRIKWRTLSDLDWYDELMPIEQMEQRDLLEENAKKRKSAKGAKTPGGQGGTGKQAKTSKRGKGDGNPGGGCDDPALLATAGGMKFCPLCHGVGLLEMVYCMHNLASCNEKNMLNQALSSAPVKPKPPRQWKRM